ncbi:MAG: hypothetical protein PHN75_19625 [Syntrophales bacterium]|nr:hypothetical protein [Syntrophales bacterium]
MDGRGRIYWSLIFITAILCTSLSWSCRPQPVIRSFTATPTTAYSGQAVTLQWEVDGTNAVNISNGVGNVANAGQAIVTPETTTTYVLILPDGSQRVSVTVKVTAAPDTTTAEKPQGTTPGSANIPVAVPPVTTTLRYDNLDNSSDDYLSDQIAIWHTYAKLPSSASTATAGYSPDIHKTFIASSSTGVPVKSPLIILPFKDGMVCIVKNYSSLSYQFFKVSTTWYSDQVDESERLSQPGWGLTTTFSPPKSPFNIQKINIAAAANNSGTAQEYDNYHFIVRILDDRGKQLWSKTLPWSLFRSGTSSGNPRAIWKSIDVGDVPVSGDFSVEVMTESNEYIPGKVPSNHYLALAYEELNTSDINSRSFISDAGSRADTWIRLYDSYGHAHTFNLCIRVDGSYQ